MARKYIIVFTVTLILGVALTFAPPLIQFTQERFAYSQKSQQLESAHQQINLGMTKEQVKTVTGEPHDMWKNDLGEVWHWSARNYQGNLWKRAGLATTKGHFGMSVILDESSKVSDKSGGVN